MHKVHAAAHLERILQCRQPLREKDDWGKNPDDQFLPEGSSLVVQPLDGPPERRGPVLVIDRNHQGPTRTNTAGGILHSLCHMTRLLQNPPSATKYFQIHPTPFPL